VRPNSAFAIERRCTSSGPSKLEVPVKRILQGSDVDEVVSADAVDRPDLLSWFATATSPASRPSS
jgi:acetoacetyl-CoA synthetase